MQHSGPGRTFFHASLTDNMESQVHVYVYITIDIHVCVYMYLYISMFMNQVYLDTCPIEL